MLDTPLNRGIENDYVDKTKHNYAFRIIKSEYIVRFSTKSSIKF